MPGRTRGARRAAAYALLVGVLFVLVPGGAAAAADGEHAELTAEQQLAARFAPVMYLVRQDERCGPGEPYQPSDVEALLGADSVALRGPWTTRDLVAVGPTAEQLSQGLRDYELDLPGDPLRPGCDYETWAGRVWGKDAQPTIYAHVARQKGVSDRLALQYAFYYPFNDYNNKHESDWERIQLEFETGDVAEALSMLPTRVTYAQHYGGEAATWGDDKLQVDDETHPRVYVSAGSHASQYAEGLYLGNSESTGFGCDTTTGPHDVVRPVVETIPSDPELAAELFPWIEYEGHWGQVGPRRFYTGPTGPNMKLFWTKPFRWSEGARDTSFPVPGAEAAGTRATTFFCSAVGTGSDAFRRYVSGSGPLLLVAGALLLGALLLWLRKDRWDSDPDRVQVPRTASQAIGASVRWVRRRPRVFAATALLTVVPALLYTAVAATDGGLAAPTWLRLLLAGVVAVSLVLNTSAVAGIVLVEPDMTAADAVRAALPRLVPTLLTVTAGALVVTAVSATVVLLPVSLGLAAAWSLLVPVIRVEGAAGWPALRRSWRLTRASRWTTIPLMLVCLGVAVLLGLVLSSAVFIFFTAPFFVVDAVPALVGAVVWPFVSVLLAFAYANAVSRFERPGLSAAPPPAPSA